MGYSRLVLKMEVIDLDLQQHFDSDFLEIQLVCVITCYGFELQSPIFCQICILGYSQLVLKMEFKIQLVRVITCNGFEMQSPNLHQISILGFPQLPSKIGVIDLDLLLALRLFVHFDSEFQETAFNVTLIDIGRPRGVTRPNVLLSFIMDIWCKIMQFYPWPPSAPMAIVIPCICLPASLSVPSDVTPLTLWAGINFCTFHRTLKFGGMMHSAMKHASWNFEIFYDRLGPGLRDDVVVLALQLIGA